MSITFNQLKKLITKKEIDTVLVCVSDMQGRLNGKRVTGKAFLDYVYKRQLLLYEFLAASTARSTSFFFAHEISPMILPGHQPLLFLWTHFQSIYYL